MTQWNKDHDDSHEVNKMDVLYLLSFEYLTTIGQFEVMTVGGGTEVYLGINLFPHIFALFDSLLLCESTRDTCLKLFSQPHILENAYILNRIGEKVCEEDNF